MIVGDTANRTGAGRASSGVIEVTIESVIGMVMVMVRVMVRVGVRG